MDGGIGGDPEYQNNDRETQAYRCRQHAIRRARERFGVELSHQDLHGLEKMIRGGRYPFVRVDRDGVQFAIELEGKRCRAVYNVTLRCVVTVLTPHVEAAGNPAPRLIRRAPVKGPL